MPTTGVAVETGAVAAVARVGVTCPTLIAAEGVGANRVGSSVTTKAVVGVPTLVAAALATVEATFVSVTGKAVGAAHALLKKNHGVTAANRQFLGCILLPLSFQNGPVHLSAKPLYTLCQ